MPLLAHEKADPTSLSAYELMIDCIDVCVPSELSFPTGRGHGRGTHIGSRYEDIRSEYE